MSKKIYVCTLAIIGGIFFISFFGNSPVFAQQETSDNTKKLCENKYDTYKKLGKDNFVKRYSHLAYLQDCFKLFDNPEWAFNGKDKIDRQYEKYYQLTAQANSLISNYENQNLEIKKISLNKIGYQNYALKVRICSENTSISEPKFFVVTDKEYFLAKSSRDLKENSCSFIMVYANAINSEGMNFFPFDGNYVPSKYLKVKSVF